MRPSVRSTGTHGNRSSSRASNSEVILPAIPRFRAIAGASAGLESARLIRGRRSLPRLGGAAQLQSGLIADSRKRGPYTAYCGATCRMAAPAVSPMPPSTANPTAYPTRACPAVVRGPVGPPRNPDACLPCFSHRPAAALTPLAKGSLRWEPGRRPTAAGYDLVWTGALPEYPEKALSPIVPESRRQTLAWNLGQTSRSRPEYSETRHKAHN